MFNRDKIDFKLILSFTNTYKRLNEKGEISDQELEEVLSLLDNYKKYSHQEFKEKLEQIFLSGKQEESGTELLPDE